MKTKTSKKVLSFILAVMMVVTSLPMMAFTAFADEAAAVDPAVKAVQDAMDSFKTKLSSSGSFTNVDVAYNAYVDCQKALDAYVYGGESDALNGKAAALKNAINNIVTFTGMKGTAVPTFANSTGTMTDYGVGGSQASAKGVAYNNVLYTTQTTSANEMRSNKTGEVVHRVFYPETTLLYDGTNDTIMPVMGMASVTDKKVRYIYASYPCVSASDNTDSKDFNLQGYWHGNSGENLDFTWSWDATNDNPSYNYATGYKGNQDTGHRSQRLSYSTNLGDNKEGWAIFKSGYTKYIANAMKFVGTPASTYSDYSLVWYVSSGDGANSDATTIDASASKIHVVNYKTLLDGLATNGNKMKLVDLADFSEGGLSDYINAMEAATDFNPNTYFTSGNNYTGCAQQIATLVANMNNAPVTNTNNEDYATLRTAMAENVRATYAAGDTGYTADSWAAFVQKYQAAQAIMAACNDSGYTSTTAATAASELITAFNNLKTNVAKVDTTALENAIDTFEAYANIFTADTYNAVKAVVDNAKTAVWGTVDDYKVPTAAPDDSVDTEALVAEQAQAVLDAIKTLVISTETVVSTDDGDKYTMVSALALENEISDPTDYSNYATFSAALTVANNYVASLETTPFTDYDAQLAEYKRQVIALVEAYNNLKRPFFKVPDGTVVSATTSAITTLEHHSNSNRYNWWIDFSYPGSAIVFKTTHDAITVPYGNSNVTFKINIDNNISKENNALDSITINGTADQNAEINNAQWTSTPPELSQTQRETTYAGCLEAENADKIRFSLTDFKVTGQMNNAKSYFGTDANGNAVSGKESATDAYTKILATTEGTSTFPARGTIALQPGAKGDSSITLTSDMNLDIPATTKKTLTGSTTPTKTNYTYSGYFGATFVRNTQPESAWAGYGYLTSKSNNELINSTVSVVDMSYLIDLVAQCNALIPEAEKYTDATWGPFQKTLEDVQADFDYKSMTADAITAEVKSRYTQLWAKYSALEAKTFSVVFNWKNSAGADASKTLKVTYGDTLSMSKYLTQINAITTPDFVANNYTYKFREWSPEINLDAAVKGDAVYVAQYDGTPNNAIWDAFNTAKAELLGVITDKTYTAADLTALNTEIEALTYFSYTDEQKDAVMADSQDKIDADTAKMTELKNGLTPASIDVSVAESAGGDADRFSAEVELYQTVNVAGEDVIGFVYATQEELDAALNASLTVRSYTIYVNGTAVTTVDYGTPMIVNSDSTYQTNVSDTHPDYDGQRVSWFYSYAAPSTDFNATARKYMTTAASFGFIVKGDTYLTTTDETTEFDGVIVTMVANLAGNSTKTYAVCYSDADGILQDAPEAPSYAYYKFVGYSCDTANLTETEDGKLQVDDFCTITANYEVDTTHANGFTINVYMGDDPSFVLNSADGIGVDFDSSEGYLVKNVYDYNEKVQFITDGFWLGDVGVEEVYALFTAEDPTDYSTYKFLCMGGTYKFYAYSDMNIIAMSRQNIEDNMSSTYNPEVTITANNTAVPIYNTDGSLQKISLVGTFCLPEGYKMVETGFLFTSQSGADLTVENVGTNGIARMKSSKYTVGNQFVINIRTSVESFDYVAYAIVTDSNGKQQIFYSDKYSGTTTNF